MATAQNPAQHMKNTTREQPSSSQALVVTLTAAEKATLAIMLAKLASHYWRPDFSPAQSAALIADYADDLGDCRLTEIELAIRTWRMDAKNQFFPKSAQLRALVLDYREHRAELDKMPPTSGKWEFGDSRPYYWWQRQRRFWKPHWREEEIPEAHRANYARWKAKNDPDPSTQQAAE